MKRSDLMSVREIADLEGCSISNIQAHARRGSLPGRKIGRDWVFLRSDYRAWRKRRLEAARERLRRLEGE